MGFFRGDDFGAKCADAMLQTAGWSRSKACHKSGSHTIRCLWYRLAAREEEAVESNFRSSCSLQGSNVGSILKRRSQVAAAKRAPDSPGPFFGKAQKKCGHGLLKETRAATFGKTKRRASSRVADLVLPPAIKKQLKDRAKEVSLKNLRPETATIQ